MAGEFFVKSLSVAQFDEAKFVEVVCIVRVFSCTALLRGFVGECNPSHCKREANEERYQKWAAC